MSAPHLATLRAASAEIRKVLHTGPTDAARQSERFPSLEQMQSLSRHLSHVDAMLQNEERDGTDADLRSALAEYAAILESLRETLKTAQEELAQYRVQLIAERGHQNAAAAWVAAYKQSR